MWRPSYCWRSSSGTVRRTCHFKFRAPPLQFLACQGARWTSRATAPIGKAFACSLRLLSLLIVKRSLTEVPTPPLAWFHSLPLNAGRMVALTKAAKWYEDRQSQEWRPSGLLAVFVRISVRRIHSFKFGPALLQLLACQSPRWTRRAVGLTGKAATKFARLLPLPFQRNVQRLLNEVPAMPFG